MSVGVWLVIDQASACAVDAFVGEDDVVKMQALARSAELEDKIAPKIEARTPT